MEYVGIPGLEHMTDEEYALLKEQDRKKYRRVNPDGWKPPGRKSWLYATNEMILVDVIKTLNAQKTLLRVHHLMKLLYMNYSTLQRLLKDGRIKPVEEPIRYHPKRGHEAVRTSQRYYDPEHIINAILLQISNREVGCEYANIEEGPGRDQIDRDLVREVPRRSRPPKVYSRKTSQLERWTKGDLAFFIDYPTVIGLKQWLTPEETGTWLRVTNLTLLRWRHKLRETGDRAKYPPYHQGPDLVPSWARGDDGLQKPLSRRRRVDASFGRRFDPVLYDRNEIVQWLKRCLQAKSNVP
jgi:hypothetical protein